MTTIERRISSHELLSLCVTPALAAGIFWGLSSLIGGSGLFAPLFLVWAVLIPAYIVLLLAAIPLYAWVKATFGIRWFSVLTAGGVCGAIIPVIIHGLLLVDATFSGQFSTLFVIVRDGAGATAFGIAIGIATATIFKLLVGRVI